MDEARANNGLVKGVSAVVVGLGREGMAVARFLAESGLLVTVTDLKPERQVKEGIAALADLPVKFAMGEHPLNLLDGAALVFVSPGVPLEIPFLAEARRRGVPLSSETRLFSRLCPATIVGITGSSGKTTTTALTGEMLAVSGCRTWVGGNIGRPLLVHLDEMRKPDVVVMELSSFQLELFAPWSGGPESKPAMAGAASGLKAPLGVLLDPSGWSPPIAAILNITPNHLDRHPSMEAYVAAKSHILAYQGSGDTAVLSMDMPETLQLGKAPGRKQRVVWFSQQHEVEEGAFLTGDRLMVRAAGREQIVCRRDELRLLGRHNVANVLAACALASAAGGSVEAMRQVATTFSGVPHRLELVRERHGVRWFNDSIATTPERTSAALQAFDAPIVLLAGGRDKHLPWELMANLTWQKARHLILFGEASALIEREMLRSPYSATGNCRIHRAGLLEKAVDMAAQLAEPGDVVLLSPGGTSFDAYQDFEARGDHFRRLVSALE